MFIYTTYSCFQIFIWYSWIQIHIIQSTYFSYFRRDFVPMMDIFSGACNYKRKLSNSGEIECLEAAQSTKVLKFTFINVDFQIWRFLQITCLHKMIFTSEGFGNRFVCTKWFSDLKVFEIVLFEQNDFQIWRFSKLSCLNKRRFSDLEGLGQSCASEKNYSEQFWSSLTVSINQNRSRNSYF